jgi:hypothetical protein
MIIFFELLFLFTLAYGQEKALLQGVSPKDTHNPPSLTSTTARRLRPNVVVKKAKEMACDSTSESSLTVPLPHLSSSHHRHHHSSHPSLLLCTEDEGTANEETWSPGCARSQSSSPGHGQEQEDSQAGSQIQEQSRST